MTSTQETFCHELWDAGTFEDYAYRLAERAAGYEMTAEQYAAKARALREISNWRPNAK